MENKVMFIDCVNCGKPATIQEHDEGGGYGWTRYSYTCTHCGHSEPDISVEPKVLRSSMPDSDE